MKPIAIGECEACNAQGDLFQAPGSSYHLCVIHYQAEVEAIQSAKVINKVVETSLKKIENTNLKADIYNAATTSFIELHAAIQHDDSIPADKKNEVLVQTAEKYITGFTQAIFDLNEQKVAKENERAGWRQATVDYIATLRETEREKYKKFNITYQPAPVTKKAIKGDKPRVSKAKVGTNLAEAKRMAEKYGLPYIGIQSLVVSKNISYEQAAIELCKMMGKPLPTVEV
jgi:hypothetical protein